MEILPQVGEKSSLLPSVNVHIQNDLFSIPWGHHKYIIDKCSDNPEKVEGTIPTIEEIEAKLNK